MSKRLEVCQQAWMNGIAPSAPHEYDQLLPLLGTDGKPTKYWLQVTWNVMRDRYEATVVEETLGQHTECTLAVYGPIYVQIKRHLDALGVYSDEIFGLSVIGAAPKPDATDDVLRAIHPDLVPKVPNRSE